MSKKPLLLSIVFFLLSSVLFSQSAKQKTLEARRTRLQKEIASVNRLLFQNQKKEESLLDYLESLQKKIQVRTDLIKAIAAESNYLGQLVQKNEDRLRVLKNELSTLKQDYANMILKSYKSKSEQSKLMFLLSSDDFFQAYKRFRYMQQYASYRKKQGEAIVAKRAKIVALTKDLKHQKSQKNILLAKNKQETQKIVTEKAIQQNLMDKVRLKEKKYLTQIRQKQAKEKALNKEIERVIREAIAASKAHKTTLKNTDKKTIGFALTPEAKALSSRFEQNRGKLPWPLSEGVVTRKYGVIPHATLKGIKVDSKGIHITTKKNAIARSVFKGKVLAIQSVSGRYAVYVQHGSYISLYNNLDKVYVSKGQEVVLKQSLGVVFTNKSTNTTVLKFQIWKNTQRQNPTYWLAKM